MLVEKKKKLRVNHLGKTKHKQQMFLAQRSSKEVSLPKFSWEKENGPDSDSVETRDQNQVNK